ncbi:MAG TPA: NAD(P)H-dependent oxidoreductase [Candidatus Saccharimonadales bacterium]|jgi:NAD(P)H-dependent FMN reductase
MKTAIIIGSTREGRLTDRLAKWVASEAAKHGDTEVLDLRDYPMPFFDEAISPRYNPARTPSEAVKKWLDKVAEFDSYVVVTPEYNRGVPAVLKNAIDELGFEIDNKPVALVAHGSSGGAQAVASMRFALPGVGAVTIPQAMYVNGRIGDMFTEEGVFGEADPNNPYGPQGQLVAQMASLKWYSDALATARAAA